MSEATGFKLVLSNDVANFFTFRGRKLPVMVWIYGGYFTLGTGEMYPGNALAVHGDMVIVNFNYRVSTLGWLSTGECNAGCNLYYAEL